MLVIDFIPVQLTNILVQEVNGTYNATLKEMNILYPVNITVWNSSLTTNYTEWLKNPVTFQYKDGEVSMYSLCRLCKNTLTLHVIWGGGGRTQIEK